MERKQRKDREATAAAMVLGRRGGKARLTKMTAARRSEIARNAALVRYGKAKPPADPRCWYGVCLLPVPEDLHGGVRAMVAILDEAHKKPDVVLWTRDRDEARARARQENLDGKVAEVIDVGYNPNRITVTRVFQPEEEAMRRLLRVDIGEGQS